MKYINRLMFAPLIGAIASVPGMFPKTELFIPPLSGPKPVAEPRKKHKRARISVAENKRRSKKRKAVKRARQSGHYTRKGSRQW